MRLLPLLLELEGEGLHIGTRLASDPRLGAVERGLGLLHHGDGLVHHLIGHSR